MGTYIATRMLEEGHHVWGTCTTPEKAAHLDQLGLVSRIADFDKEGDVVRLEQQVFDLVIISVPITHKDPIDVVKIRFARLLAFLQGISCGQSVFFGSVGIYPKVSAVIAEDTFADPELDAKLLTGERTLRSVYPDVNILRLGGLFGFERVMAKYFVGSVCEIGYQTANFIHVADIYGIIRAMIAKCVRGKTYNVVCPDHPLKKDIIKASAAKYGYGLPAAFTDTDKTAKKVSSGRLVADLDYRFVYPSPLQF